MADPKDKPGNGNGEKSSDLSDKPSWSTAAALLVTAINGGIAFYGWNSAKDIQEYDEAAKNKLSAIQQVVERGYILYARGLEREFTELIANNPGTELTGVAVEQLRSSIEEDSKSLETLEKEIPQDKRLPIKFLMDGFLVYLQGDCHKAISSLSQYSKETPVKYLLLASANQRCGNTQQAIALNNKVKDLPMTRPSVRIKAKAVSNNGNSSIRNGQFNEAISYFKSALQIDPTLYGVNYNLAIAYTKLGKQEDAIKALCRYKTVHDGNVIEEVESDPDNDFQQLISSLGTDWKKKLEDKLNACHL